jgi:type II secretory pathway component PulF
MPEKPPEVYDVRMTDADGRDASRSVNGLQSVEQLVAGCRANGLQVSAVKRSGAVRRLFEPRGVSGEEFAAFNAELSAACARGVPMPEALRELSRDMRSRRFRAAVERAAAAVEGGRSLPEALAGEHQAFPPAYSALLRAGLATGNLPGTLLLLAREARFNARFRHEVLAALGYPVLIIVLSSIVMSAVSRMLLPVVFDTFDSMDIGELPAIVELLLATATAMRWAPAVTIGSLLLVLGAWHGTATLATGARFLGWLRLKLPVIGRMFHAVAMARFCRMLSAALSANVPVPESLELAGLATGNAAIRAATATASAAVREGQPVSRALDARPELFPSMLVWMLSLGEARGEVVPVLTDLAALHEEDADRRARIVPPILAALATALAAGMLVITILAVTEPLLWVTFKIM